MKTSTLRNAISIALFVAATGAGEWVMAQEAPKDTTEQNRASAADASGRTDSKKATDTASPTTTTNLESVQVTGTRIRGGSMPSPVITIDSEQFQQEGFTDLGEVIRNVPQNFSGGQNPGVVVGATAGAGGLANQNVTGGSSLNLRGLGPDATLTLLNGRRLSYGGFVQAVDISAIPMEAVDRIEIVPDGASAIYGSDAVGGVGNVILKRDYEGGKIGVRYGGATDGGLTTREYTVTAGAHWSTGGMLAALQDTSSDPIYARQRDYTEYMFDPNSLYPRNDLRSGLVSLHQSISDAVEVQVDALGADRGQKMYPWNTGLTSYHFELVPKTKTRLVAPSVDITMAGGWTLLLGGSWGRDESVVRQSIVDTPPAAGRVTTHECYCNRAVSWDVGAEGPVVSIPGGDARLAIGAGGRKTKFTDRNLLTNTDVIQGREGNRFAYAELNLPLVGSAQGVSGVHRLDLTAAVRGEDYSSFGRVATPKVGLIYGPNADITVKASWGKSFKAPTLFQRYQPRAAYVISESYYGGSGDGANAAAMGVSGGDRDLKPERATTKTISLAVHPEALRGMEAELTWFNIDYTNRVVEPITDYSRAIGNPDYEQFIDYLPTEQKLLDVIGSASVFYNYLGRPYEPSDVVVIVHSQYVNVARQHIKGLDLSASNRFDVGMGMLTLRGSATWLDSTQQNSVSQAPYDVAGTLFNPARINARAGAVWGQGGFSASVFANYTSGVMDRVSDRKTASFTTMDATLRYTTGPSTGALSGIEVALSAQNLLNREPPSYVALSPDHPPYDSTNYSAIGRFMSLSVSKRW